VDWVKGYILFNHKTHPKDKGGNEVQGFFSYLASDYREIASICCGWRCQGGAHHLSCPLRFAVLGVGPGSKIVGLQTRLECYKPAAQRVYGYFSLPILHKDRLVGRFDPKLDHKSGGLHLNALYLEPGIEPDDGLVTDVATARGV
jgi:hypothetical protein